MNPLSGPLPPEDSDAAVDDAEVARNNSNGDYQKTIVNNPAVAATATAAPPPQPAAPPPDDLNDLDGAEAPPAAAPLSLSTMVRYMCWCFPHAPVQWVAEPYLSWVAGL